MHDPFRADSKVFGELLGDIERSHFVVPKFQRGFSWEKKHIQHFWDDIRRFQGERGKANAPTKYFLGLIVTMPDKSNPDVTFVLDGQQRLATATILLAVIRDAAKAIRTQEAVSFSDDVHAHSILKPDGHTFALELGETDKLYFAETVQSKPPQDREIKNRWHKNIHSAKKLLGEMVADLLHRKSKTQKLKELRELVTVIKSDLIMARVPVEELGHAFRIFETLNDRGLSLSVPDLLLNYLMGMAKDEEHDDIREFWTEIVDEIGKHSLKNFLRDMWVSEHGDEKRELFPVIKQEIESKEITSLDFARRASAQCTKYMQLVEANEAFGRVRSLCGNDCR